MSKRKLASLILVGCLLSISSFTTARADSSSALKIKGAKSSETDNSPVELDADFYIPDSIPAPAIVLAHGFGGNKKSVSDQAEMLRQAGFVVLAYTARGFDQSSGSISMNSQEFEIADAQEIIDFLSSKSEVIQDTTNDPRVGFAGGSYGGALSLMIAGLDQRVDAVVSDITWHSLETALFPQNAIGLDYPGVFKELWTGYFFNRGLSNSEFVGSRCGRFAPKWCELYESVAQSGTYSSEQEQLMFNSSPISTNMKLDAPTLLLAGQADSLFPLTEADANYQQIKMANPDLPLKFVWHSGGHDGGIVETERIQELTLQWFKSHLSGTGNADEKFEVTFTSGNVIGSNQEEGNGVSVETSDNYFGLGNSTGTLPLLGKSQQILAPAGGAPAGISTFPGIGSIGSALSQLIPGQNAIFQTPPLEKQQRILGSSQIQINVSSLEERKDVVLFASLRIVKASGSQTLPNGLVSAIRLPTVSSTPTTVLINLPAIAIDAKSGDSLRVVISTTDLGYRLPTEPAEYKIELAAPVISIASGTLVSQSSNSLNSVLLAVTALVVLVIVVILWLKRPKYDAKDVREDLSEIPIKIINLVKQFKNGPRAVDDISYEIPRGKVVGLLGPNGAGKTTTMRMIMGLIQPTEGSVYVFGEKVSPGAPVLSRIGSLVEGAGFLPHLTGRENLTLYWQASGRSGIPNFAEVLEIADLGTAIDRKVRTYSQGMRQRLGIAQAMLGMPDLLMLDEPTNGLDPPQIKAMRDVLHKYVETGRTVIVSSHLLSEVEQTCSYVVVMHRGRLITAGEVADLLASHSNVRLEDFFLDVVGDDLTIGKTQ